jgi:hypothetical protein
MWDRHGTKEERTLASGSTFWCSCDSHKCEPTLQSRKQEADIAVTNYDVTVERGVFLEQGRQCEQPVYSVKLRSVRIKMRYA